ncbi:hypothetical protein [Pseudomonas paeninsulae]|uniref:hypothetical protein n=1 Tax=Pseudomonas paeninsulae TaxID=3110772 RepID=UPI002D78C984|nr:hypothetical protein [Pseudomonas sp. IT1137]
MTRQNVRDLDSGLNLLSWQRLDARIDMCRPLPYKLAQRPERPLHFCDLAVQRYDLYCIYGQHLPSGAKWLDEVLLELRDSGTIARMLDSTPALPPQ